MRHLALAVMVLAVAACSSSADPTPPPAAQLAYAADGSPACDADVIRDTTTASVVWGDLTFTDVPTRVCEWTCATYLGTGAVGSVEAVYVQAPWLGTPEWTLYSVKTTKHAGCP